MPMRYTRARSTTQSILATGRPLPGETEAYVAKMKSLIEVAYRERSRSVLRHAIRCQNAPVFIEQFGGASADGEPAPVAPLMASSSVPSVATLMTLFDEGRHKFA